MNIIIVAFSLFNSLNQDISNDESIDKNDISLNEKNEKEDISFFENENEFDNSEDEDEEFVINKKVKVSQIRDYSMLRKKNLSEKKD